MRLNHQLEEDVSCKVLHFITNEDQEELDYKILRRKNAVKQTIVKNLGGNIPEKQFTIVKRSFRSSTKLLSLDSTILVDELTVEKPSTALESLNSSIYERHPLMHESQYVTNQLRRSQYAT